MSDVPADTTPDAQARFQHLLMQRSGEERVQMACDMFQAARRLMVAALPAEIAADAVERKIALLIRTYGGDLDTTFLAAVTADLRARAGNR